MAKQIAFCGLDCAKCDVRIATLKNDEEFTRIVAERWQNLWSDSQITPESVRCTGCRTEGEKFVHCSGCKIRSCAKLKGYETCGECSDMEFCETVASIHLYVPEAVLNLKLLNLPEQR